MDCSRKKNGGRGYGISRCIKEIACGVPREWNFSPLNSFTQWILVMLQLSNMVWRSTHHPTTFNVPTHCHAASELEFTFLKQLQSLVMEKRISILYENNHYTTPYKKNCFLNTYLSYYHSISVFISL